MASIDKRHDGQWRARWREYPGGPQRSKHFARKVDADQFLVKVQHDQMTGVYIAPAAAKVRLDEYAVKWLDRMTPTWRASTAELVRGSLLNHVLPVLGRRPITTIRRTDVEAFCAALPLAPSTVRTVHQHLGQLLDGAVDDGLIPRNPAAKARLPRNEGRKVEPVPLEVAEAIHDALPGWMRIVVPLGIGAGLRQGEVSGLTVDRIDMLRRTLRVDRQLVTRSGHPRVLAPPKTQSSNRTIPLAGFVVDAIAGHLTDGPADRGRFLLTDPQGRWVDANHFGHPWRRAVAGVGVPGLRYHDLRHTFASTLLSNGVNVRAVADWLGHASPMITLATYAHLMPLDDEVARSVLDAALAPAEDSVRTETTL